MLKKINTSLAHSYAIWGKLVPSGFGYEMYFFSVQKSGGGKHFLQWHIVVQFWDGEDHLGSLLKCFFLFCAEGGGRINMLSLTQNFGWMHPPAVTAHAWSWVSGLPKTFTFKLTTQTGNSYWLISFLFLCLLILQPCKFLSVISVSWLWQPSLVGHVQLRPQTHLSLFNLISPSLSKWHFKTQFNSLSFILRIIAILVSFPLLWFKLAHIGPRLSTDLYFFIFLYFDLSISATNTKHFDFPWWWIWDHASVIRILPLNFVSRISCH